MTPEQIKISMKKEYIKALKALKGYKFLMFGYHAANWVNLNKLLLKKLPNPFKNFVDMAEENWGDIDG